MTNVEKTPHHCAEWKCSGKTEMDGESGYLFRETLDTVSSLSPHPSSFDFSPFLPCLHACLLSYFLRHYLDRQTDRAGGTPRVSSDKVLGCVISCH